MKNEILQVLYENKTAIKIVIFILACILIGHIQESTPEMR